MKEDTLSESMKTLIELGHVEWRAHALKRMLERNIKRSEVLDILLHGECIEDYPNDYPWPSGLFSGQTISRTLHVVAALDMDGIRVAIVTTYEPDLEFLG